MNVSLFFFLISKFKKFFFVVIITIIMCQNHFVLKYCNNKKKSFSLFHFYQIGNQINHRTFRFFLKFLSSDNVYLINTFFLIIWINKLKYFFRFHYILCPMVMLVMKLKSTGIFFCVKKLIFSACFFNVTVLPHHLLSLFQGNE